MIFKILIKTKNFKIISVIFTTFLLILLNFFYSSCTQQCCFIQAPPVNITSERTSLEKQILDTYQEIREDVWIISSAQTIEGMEIKTSTNTNNVLNKQSINTKVLKALQTIE